MLKIVLSTNEKESRFRKRTNILFYVEIQKENEGKFPEKMNLN